MSPEYVEKHLHDKNIVMIDTTDAKTYAQGHIPNAVNVSISKFRHPVGPYQLMNSSKEIEQVAISLGINNDSKIIIYGHNKGKDLLKASYIALALIVNGAKDVSILNGNYFAWLDEYDHLKEMIETASPKIKEGNFTAKYNPNVLVDMQYVLERINKVPMIEARPLIYYTGEAQSKGVKRPGHIKGAKSSYWKDKFYMDETLKPDEDLKAIYETKNGLNPKKEVIAYCTGGLEASMNWYILSQYLKYSDVKLYDASMRQWGNIDTTPMEK